MSDKKSGSRMFLPKYIANDIKAIDNKEKQSLAENEWVLVVIPKKNKSYATLCKFIYRLIWFFLLNRFQMRGINVYQYKPLLA